MFLKDVFKASTVDEGLKYAVLAFQPEMGGMAQIVRGPVISEGDWKGFQIGVMLQNAPFPTFSGAQFLGYTATLPRWAEQEPPTTRDLMLQVQQESRALNPS